MYRLDLVRKLRRLNGRYYTQLESITGEYLFENSLLCIDFVQNELFSPASRMRCIVRRDLAGYPGDLIAKPIHRLALEDFILRKCGRELEKIDKELKREFKSNCADLSMDDNIYIFTAPVGDKVLPRNAFQIDEQDVVFAFSLCFIALGRKVLGDRLGKLICDSLVPSLERCICWKYWGNAEIEAAYQCRNSIENQSYIRSELSERGLVAFIGNGTVIHPDSSSDRNADRYAGQEIFTSPEALEVTIDLPQEAYIGGKLTKRISGMGIGKGVTVISGVGDSEARDITEMLARGVYLTLAHSHREYVVTDDTAVNVPTTPGRSVVGVDISPLIASASDSSETKWYFTLSAGDATSQAANIVEALEVGSKLLLLNEDCSARQIVESDAGDQEGRDVIEHLSKNLRWLYDDLGVSTILVTNSNAELSQVADTEIAMRGSAVEGVCRREFAEREVLGASLKEVNLTRIPVAKSISARHSRREVKVVVRPDGKLIFGENEINLADMGHLVDTQQIHAAAFAVYQLSRRYFSRGVSLHDALKALDQEIEDIGISCLYPLTTHRKLNKYYLARPRRFEIAAILNRLPTLQVLVPD